MLILLFMLILSELKKQGIICGSTKCWGSYDATIVYGGHGPPKLRAAIARPLRLGIGIVPSYGGP